MTVHQLPIPPNGWNPERFHRTLNKPHRVLVCGGRGYNDYAKVCEILDPLKAEHGDDLLIIHGAAPGADSLADRWCRDRGVPFLSFPADWAKHGRAAGPIRNKLMLDTTHPTRVVAFPGGRGTKHMTTIALQAGILVEVVL